MTYPDSPNDFIDSYLTKIDDSPLDSSFHGVRGLQNLRSTILDLLLAGSETTSTALTWAVLFMIRYPDIQKRVQQEITQVVGTSRLPRIEDRSAELLNVFFLKRPKNQSHALKKNRIAGSCKLCRRIFFFLHLKKCNWHICRCMFDRISIFALSNVMPPFHSAGFIQ